MAEIARLTAASVEKWAAVIVRRSDGTHAKLLAIQVNGRDVTSEPELYDFLDNYGIEGKARLY